MIHWLFTDGRELLASFLWPLLCLTPLLLLVTAARMGAGIRRSSEDVPQHTSRRSVIATYLAVMLTSTAIFVTLVGEHALQRGRNTARGVLDVVIGAPDRIDSSRLFLFAVVLGGTLVVTGMMVRSALRDGGWLRERLDRLRIPQAKRGALGSSHFWNIG